MENVCYHDSILSLNRFQIEHGDKKLSFWTFQLKKLA